MSSIAKQEIAGQNTGVAICFNSHWLKRVLRGTSLLFWSILIPPVFVNSIGFLLPFVGGNFQTLKWVTIIYAISGVPLLFGALAFSLSPESMQASVPNQLLRNMVRFVAILEILNRAMYSLFQIIFDSTQTIYVWLPMELVGAITVLIGSTYLRQMCKLQNFGRLEIQTRIFLWMYGALFLASILWGLELLEPLSSLAPLLSVLLSIFGIFVFIWGLTILWKFRTKLIAILQGRCSNCGYDLTGLPERRCPECGTEFKAKDVVEKNQ